MKRLLFYISIFFTSQLYSQITIEPATTHYTNPYNANIYGSGTIYYTTDGSTPTLSSSSALNNVQIPINTNKEIKAFLVNSQGVNSAVFTQKYYVGTLPTSKIYFKPPSTWTMGVGIFVDMVNPNAVNGGVVDSFWPGFQMTNTGCDGWYRYNAYYENANVRFTNNTLYEFLGGLSTGLIPVGNLVYYDFTNGAISNPPACLILGTGETDKKPITLVKVYPNPISEILKVHTEIDFQEYEIIDMTGKMIFKNKFSKEISVSHLSSGTYFIKLKNKDGNSTLLKFIKK